MLYLLLVGIHISCSVSLSLGGGVSIGGSSGGIVRYGWRRTLANANTTK